MSELTVSAILKCINQGIAAPSIMALRMGLMGKLNYKDCGNNWDIDVQFNANSIVVAHQKVRLKIVYSSNYFFHSQCLTQMCLSTP